MQIVNKKLLFLPREGTITLVTTNSFVRKDGALVMGAGAAKAATIALPGIQFEFGKVIRHMSTYGVKWAHHQGHWWGAFQVKRFWGDQASLELIGTSTERLARVAMERPHITFRMNFPGIGNGKLDYDDVLPIVKALPDNVHLYLCAKH